MSFQHFRLHPLTQQTQPTVLTQSSQSSLSQALGHHPPPSLAHHQHVPQHQQTIVLNGAAPPTLHIQHVENGAVKKGPYGSGEPDDGYTLTFDSMDAFNEWRRREEDDKMVEFVKGDTHGSKAVPPRFREHTKLVCARHTRSGRKKYVKKFPDRVRKVPSRKLEGQGCPASISYKTYFDTDEVRVSYISEHSHEIGMANLPYTKRGRRSQVLPDNSQESMRDSTEMPESPSPVSTPTNAVAGPSSSSSPVMQHPPPPPPPPTVPPPISHVSPQHAFQPPPPMPMYVTPPQPPPQPPPSQHHAPPQQSHPPMVPAPLSQNTLTQERWDRMAVLFQGIRENARNFDYPGPSVAALESILIRLYLESPMATNVPMGGG